MNTKSLRRAALNAVAAATLSAALVPAHALTESQQRTVTFAVAASTAWGVVGGVDILITKLATYNGRADQWAQVAGAICGTGAAGLLTGWKPPQDAINGKNILLSVLKAGGVISSAKVCNWATVGLYSAMVNTEFAGAVNDSVISTWNNATGDWERWNTTNWVYFYNNTASTMVSAGTALANFSYWNDIAYKNNCTGGNNSQYCQNVMANRQTNFNNYQYYHAEALRASWDLANMTQNASQINGQLMPPLNTSRP